MALTLATSSGLPMPVFTALSAEGSIVSFALYAPISDEGVNTFTGEEVTLPAQSVAWSFGETLCRDPDDQRWLALIHRADVGVATLETDMGRRLSPRAKIYVPYDPLWRRILPPYNMLSETFLSKDGAPQHILQRQINVIGEIVMPFPDSGIEECGARLTINADIGSWTSATAEALDDTAESYQSWAATVWPALSLSPSSLTVAPEAEKTITAQLTAPNGGADLAKSGVRLFANAPSGYLPYREVQTDAQGRAEIPFQALGLRDGDVGAVEIGFKWNSNLASCDIEITTPSS